MPHLESTTTAKTAMTDGPPFGPGFTPEQAGKAERMEVWGSSFSDPGPDFCEFVLRAPGGEVIARKRISGY